VLKKCYPRRIKQVTNYTYVEEFLVQWDPEECTVHEHNNKQNKI